MKPNTVIIEIQDERAYIEHSDGQAQYAQILGRATGADGRERVWLDRRVHRGDESADHWQITGAVSTVLVSRG